MKILVTGANGFVGKHVCELLLAQQHEVRAAVRLHGSSPSGTREYVVGDLGDVIEWSDALADIDAVIHLAARVHIMDEGASDPLAEFRRINVDATIRLAKRSQELGVKRFVFMSSIAVNGNRTHSVPFDVFSEADPSGPYGQSKWEAEKALTELSTDGNMSVISVRTPMVYGPDAPGNTRRLIRLATTGLPVPLGNAVNKRTLISVLNLSGLLVECASQPGLGAGLVMAGDDYSPSTAELFREVSRSIGRKPRIWALPVPVLSALAKAAGKSADLSRLTDSLEVRNSTTVTGLVWQPKVLFQDAIRELGKSVKKGSKP